MTARPSLGHQITALARLARALETERLVTLKGPDLDYVRGGLDGASATLRWLAEHEAIVRDVVRARREMLAARDEVGS